MQSNYIPWKGYFDLIGLVDEFILFDDRQYTRRDWRNRNLIKTEAGPRWLTIPVQVSGRYLQRIDETLVADPQWPDKHWAAIEAAYRRAACFSDYGSRLRALFESVPGPRLSDVNRHFLTGICSLIGIPARVTWSTDYAASGDRTERLVTLCTAAGASRYLSGPAARAYIEPAAFAAAGIELEYMDYSGYPEYRQLHGGFDHAVSIVDLLLNCGPEAPAFMKWSTR